MEKAKELLLEGMKAVEVSQKVGFSDNNYFYSKFKKYVGLSPNAYKDSKKQ